MYKEVIIFVDLIPARWGVCRQLAYAFNRLDNRKCLQACLKLMHAEVDFILLVCLLVKWCLVSILGKIISHRNDASTIGQFYYRCMHYMCQALGRGGTGGMMNILESQHFSPTYKYIHICREHMQLSSTVEGMSRTQRKVYK